MDYIFRCDSPEFEQLCLYDFVSLVVKRKRNKPRHSGQFSSESHPQYSTHYQVLRAVRLLPVILGPKFHRSDRSDAERELWAQDIVILFKPWRLPTDLRSREQTWADVVTSLLEHLSPLHERIVRNMNVLSECRDAR
ncbi:hypothetical protein B0H16DRAFT_1333019, partial [Mycena metata]